jgi:hypothetical protein
MITKRKLGIGLAIAAAFTLVAFDAVVRASQPTAQAPQLVSMEQSAQALQQAGAAMLAHGQLMLDAGQAAGDQDLVDHGEHWLRDGRELVQRGQWLAMSPTSPVNLNTSPADLAAQGSWGALTQTAQAMLHDPSRAREIDLQALSWNGQAMRAEGQTMAEHGRVMTEEVEVMVARHALEGQAATDLRQAARAMLEVGGYLAQNGQSMINYADRLRQSMGFR